MDNKVLVICRSTGRVPFLGMGPALKGVYLPKAQFDSLKMQGYNVTIVEVPGAEKQSTTAVQDSADALETTRREELSKKTVKELKADLTDAGVAFEPDAKKADLVEAAIAFEFA